MEPILAEGGDLQISSEFAQGIRDLTHELGIYFICDEVQTGCVTSGTYWAHEQWNLSSPPDMVTFAKKMQSAGFYLQKDLRNTVPFRHFNTWMGDPVRAFLSAK